MVKYNESILNKFVICWYFKPRLEVLMCSADCTTDTVRQSFTYVYATEHVLIHYRSIQIHRDTLHIHIHIYWSTSGSVLWWWWIFSGKLPLFRGHTKTLLRKIEPMRRMEYSRLHCFFWEKLLFKLHISHFVSQNNLTKVLRFRKFPVIYKKNVFLQ